MSVKKSVNRVRGVAVPTRRRAPRSHFFCGKKLSLNILQSLENFPSRPLLPFVCLVARRSMSLFIPPHVVVLENAFFHPRLLRGEVVSPRLLTVDDVAAQLAVSRSTIMRLQREGHFDTVRIGRAVRISEESVDAYIDSHTDYSSVRITG